MFKLLTRRNIALLWAGGLISLIGDWILLTALPYYVYQVTDSLLATAAMMVVELAPAVIFSSVAGVFVDRWNRKVTLVISNLLQAVVVLFLLFIKSTDWLWVLYVVMFAQSILSLFVAPAEHALLPHLVPEKGLTTANSLFSLHQQIARLAGPPIGGALLAWFGITPVVLLDSASFLLVALMLLGLRLAVATSVDKEAETEGATASEGKNFWRDWLEGWKIIIEKSVLLKLMIILGIMTFGGTMISPLFPAFASDIMKINALEYGLISTFQAIGGIIGGLLVGHFGKRFSNVQLLIWGNFLVGALLLIRYNIPLFWITIVISLIIGPEQVAVGAALQTLLQTSVENRYQGRLFGIMSTTGALLSMLGAATAGPLGERFGVVAVLNVTAVLTLLAAGVAFVALNSSGRTRRKDTRGGDPVFSTYDGRE